MHLRSAFCSLPLPHFTSSHYFTTSLAHGIPAAANLLYCYCAIYTPNFLGFWVARSTSTHPAYPFRIPPLTYSGTPTARHEGRKSSRTSAPELSGFFPVESTPCLGGRDISMGRDGREGRKEKGGEGRGYERSKVSEGVYGFMVYRGTAGLIIIITDGGIYYYYFSHRLILPKRTHTGAFCVLNSAFFYFHRFISARHLRASQYALLYISCVPRSTQVTHSESSATVGPIQPLTAAAGLESPPPMYLSGSTSIEGGKWKEAIACEGVSRGRS